MKLRRSSIAISLACGILASGTVAAAQTQNPSQTEVSAKASDLSFQSTSTLLTDAILPHELQAGQPITVSFQKPAAMMLAQSPPDLAPDPKPTEGSPVPKTDSVFPSADEVVPKSINPGRDTRSGASYVGVGGNFGAIGGTSVGDSGLILYSKVGLSKFFSVRPAITTNFTDDATFLLPMTLDFAPIEIGKTEIKLAPYFGGGVAVSTDGDFGPLLTGGVDIPVTKNLTATAGVNVGVLDPVDLGVFVGIGYNFGGLF